MILSQMLDILFKYITIGTQLLEIYHVLFFLMFFALTNSFTSFGARWLRTSLTIGC